MKITVDGENLEESPYVAEKVLLDTNLLVYAHNRASPHYRKASCILVASTLGPLDAYVSYQNILEFYSVMTNPRRIRPPPPSSEVQEICADLWESRKLKKIFPRERSSIDAVKMAESKGLAGPRIFDCFLAITARDNRVDRIWTDNVSDFRGLEFLTAENPLTKSWKLSRSSH